MRKITAVLALVGGLFLVGTGSAYADTPVYVSMSSVTWCAISVSTSVPTRVDNFNGSCEGLMASRNVVRVINLTGTLHAGFSASLSTSTSSNRYGDIINPNDKIEYQIGSTVPLYLMSEAASSSPTVIIQQARVGR